MMDGVERSRRQKVKCPYGACQAPFCLMSSDDDEAAANNVIITPVNAAAREQKGHSRGNSASKGLFLK